MGVQKDWNDEFSEPSANKKPKDEKFFEENNIAEMLASAGGGILGGAGGALLGTAALPGVGTAAGTYAGGTAGSILAANLVRKLQGKKPMSAKEMAVDAGTGLLFSPYGKTLAAPAKQIIAKKVAESDLSVKAVEKAAEKIAKETSEMKRIKEFATDNSDNFIERQEMIDALRNAGKGTSFLRNANKAIRNLADMPQKNYTKAADIENAADKITKNYFEKAAKKEITDNKEVIENVYKRAKDSGLLKDISKADITDALQKEVAEMINKEQGEAAKNIAIKKVIPNSKEWAGDAAAMIGGTHLINNNSDGKLKHDNLQIGFIPLHPVTAIKSGIDKYNKNKEKIDKLYSDNSDGGFIERQYKDLFERLDENADQNNDGEDDATTFFAAQNAKEDAKKQMAKETVINTLGKIVGGGLVNKGLGVFGKVGKAAQKNIDGKYNAAQFIVKQFALQQALLNSERLMEGDVTPLEKYIYNPKYEIPKAFGLDYNKGTDEEEKERQISKWAEIGKPKDRNKQMLNYWTENYANKIEAMSKRKVDEKVITEELNKAIDKINTFGKYLSEKQIEDKIYELYEVYNKARD